MRRALTAVMFFLALGLAGTARADDRPRPQLANRIPGATQMFAATWGLVAQGRGMLRILPHGTTRWQVVHRVPKGSLYRVAYDDAGRLLGAWEKQPHFHLFVPAKKEHVTFELPPPPTAEFKYGFNVEDLYFTADGSGAIVYMHGFLGGRTWATVAYHYDLVKRTPPTLLFRQHGHPLHTSAKMTVRAIPLEPDDMCEHTSCHPLGAIIAWQIDGARATKHVLLDGKAHQDKDLSRVQPVGSDSTDRVAVLVTGHPRGRYLLRWRRGDARAELVPLADGPDFDTMAMWLTASGDAVELWLTEDRGLEIRRHPLRGKTTTTRLARLPPRTPRDRPLFHVDRVMERLDGELIVHWGEYLVLLPLTGPPRRVDLRTTFKRRSEISSRVLNTHTPDGVWVGVGGDRIEDFAFLRRTDLEALSVPAP